MKYFKANVAYVVATAVTIMVVVISGNFDVFVICCVANAERRSSKLLIYAKCLFLKL